MSLLSHTHVLEALLHTRHHLVGPQHDVVRLSVVVPGIRTYTDTGFANENVFRAEDSRKAGDMLSPWLRLSVTM